MTHEAANTHPLGPTEDQPEYGLIAEYGITVSGALHWVEDGRHIFRSTEFDLTAEGEDIAVAVRQFYEKAEDLCVYLLDLIQEKQATEHEREVAGVLVPRMMQVWRESDRRLHEAQRRIFNVPRMRRAGPGWRRESTQKRSSQPLPV